MDEIKLKDEDSMKATLQGVLQGEFAAFETELINSAGEEFPAPVLVMILVRALNKELQVDGSDYQTDVLRFQMNAIISAIVDGDPSAALEAWEQVSK